VVFRRTLTGAERVMVYRVALGTGFRAAELAALVPDNFDLDATVVGYLRCTAGRVNHSDNVHT
jgi:integrase